MMNIAASLLLVLTPMTMLTGSAYAAGSCTDTPAKQQVYGGISVTGGNCDDSGFMGAIAAGVNILSIIIGVAAIFAIMLAGFKYISSGGDSTKVANAKSTLTYALVGLFIAALAQLLVHFVLFQATKA